MRRSSALSIAIILIAALTRAASAAEPAPGYNWSGFYLGLNVGWGWGKAETNFSRPTLGVALGDSTKPTGAIGGVQGGYNWQSMSSWLFGFETDIQLSGEASGNNLIGPTLNLPAGGVLSFQVINAFNHNDEINWFGTMRGRVGYTVLPNAVFYATGGLAYGGVRTSSVATVSQVLCVAGACGPPTTTNPSVSGSGIKTGWTAGGGVMGLVPNSRVTWKFEYLYIDLGTSNYSFNNTPASLIVISSRSTANIVRAGFDLHF